MLDLHPSLLSTILLYLIAIHQDQPNSQTHKEMYLLMFHSAVDVACKMDGVVMMENLLANKEKTHRVE